MTQSHYNALPSGTQLFEYRIESVLGQGGFGLTYKALDTQLNRAVAIKEYYPKEYCSRENDTSRVRASGNADDFETFKWGLDRFLTEAKTLARFHNPSIVAIRRFFELNNTAYIVMDFVEGRPLDSILKDNGTIPWAQLEDFLRPLVEGLGEVHKAGVLHRDIKPGNIYIKKDGKPILLDFGAASQEIVQHSKSVTSMASPGYGAFEQYSTHGRQGPYTDVYGLSATLYHVVTGKKPQDAPDRMLEDKVEKASVVAAGKYPVGLLQAIDSGLNVRPNDRPQTIEAWAEFLGDVNKAKVTTKAAISSKDKNSSSSKKLMFTGIAIAILIPIAIFSWWFFSSTSAPEVAAPGSEQVASANSVTTEQLPEGATDNNAVRSSMEIRGEFSYWNTMDEGLNFYICPDKASRQLIDILAKNDECILARNSDIELMMSKQFGIEAPQSESQNGSDTYCNEYTGTGKFIYSDLNSRLEKADGAYHDEDYTVIDANIDSIQEIHLVEKSCGQTEDEMKKIKLSDNHLPSNQAQQAPNNSTQLQASNPVNDSNDYLEKQRQEQLMAEDSRLKAEKKKASQLNSCIVESRTLTTDAGSVVSLSEVEAQTFCQCISRSDSNDLSIRKKNCLNQLL